MLTLPKKYKHKEIEPKLQGDWLQSGVYNWVEAEAKTRDDSYVIDTPPPTVSGSLHMGHIFSYVQADFVARYQRMKGKNVFYPMGFDDNGLPTERLVEKTIKKRAVDLTREEFTIECEKVAEGARKEFRELFESIALSVDWNQEYHTISKDSVKLSQMSFLDLYNKQRAYRQMQPMLWDPIDQTAIAQAEVEDKEKDSHENYIPFTIIDADGNEVEKVTIMTTRPELLPACVALMCHPDNASKFEGKKARTPLFNVDVPIYADEKVDKEKGTGLVMCCTFGDETDIEWWKKHSLDTKIIINKYGKIIDEVEELKGLKIEAARKKVLELLTEAGLLLEQKEISHAVKCAERSGAALEFLPTNQWFVKILDIKDELKAKVEECNWNPDFMKVRANQWIDGLSWDWCISRQRYFGVPFPIWYSKRAGEEGKVIIATADEMPVNPLVTAPNGYSMDEVEPEKDVMDTWATSSVSPQLNSKGINTLTPTPLPEGEEQFLALDSERHSKLFPADLRPQAHEIIRTWAFYTIVKSYLHEQVIPWKNLMISGWCLAEDKTKMSKSKGNIVAPQKLIEEKSADVVRYWASTSKLGSDTAVSEDVFSIGKKLVNKIWNASKFIAMQLGNVEINPAETAREDINNDNINQQIDKDIISKLSRTIAAADEAFSKYEYSTARSAVEDFFWNDLCDNYLEIVKKRAYNDGGGLVTKVEQSSALYALHHVLKVILKLFAPFTPHITEEIYTHIFEGQGSVHAKGGFPNSQGYPQTEEQVFDDVVEVLQAVRKIKADEEVSIKYEVENLFISGEETDFIEQAEFDLLAVCNAVKFSAEAGGSHSNSEYKFTVGISI